ncbi:MAG: family 10 glycosylhydrolase [Kiritimatiellae bacterium]|nr:family 10 glycosylhydrolase [Kiritimatiellia bacterium]
MNKITAIIIAVASALAAGMASASEVAVVAAEPGYYTSLANHVSRWLRLQGIAAETASKAALATELEDAKIAFLVGFDSPGADEMKVLRKYRGRGGKLVVFYSSSPALASLMDVRVLGYAKADRPGKWSRMDFSAKYPSGLPPRILQTSTVLQRAEPIKGRGRVIATWADRQGRTTGDAAWLATAGGYWMTHVLLADGDEALKARLLAAFVGSVAPHLWNAGEAAKKAAAASAALRELALAQSPRKGEIHAVWDHSGCGLYPGDWPRTMRLLRESHVTDLFVNVAGAAFAHYPSDVLPRSRIYAEEGDQLKACLAAARDAGIRVHAWMLCFTATRATPDRIEALRRKGWLLTARDGSKTEYLDPSNPQVCDYILSAIGEITSKYAVSGIHLDFVRWYERAAKRPDAAADITRFVARARERVRRPVWLTAAVLGKYPACVASVGQDWESWLDAGIVDYAVPMDYTEDMAKFETFVLQHSSSRSRARRTIAGIGVTANESRLDAAKVIAQLRMARRYGLAGAALFDLDTTLEKQILPYLRLGIW